MSSLNLIYVYSYQMMNKIIKNWVTLSYWVPFGFLHSYSFLQTQYITLICGVITQKCSIETGWSVASHPTNGETVNSLGACSALAPTNPHSNGRIK